MDKDFLTTIQPSSDHFPCPLLYGNRITPSLKENFVVSTFADLRLNNPSTISANTISSGFGLLDHISPIGNVCAIDSNAADATQIDYLKNSQMDLIYGNELLNTTLFTEDENPHWHIADAGMSCKSLVESHNLSDFYTTPQVASEAGGNLSHFLLQENICLQSLTPRDFKENGNIVTVTSPFGEIGTVSFRRENNGTVTLGCSHYAAATLTNTATGESVTICGDMLYSKSTNDFSLAVQGIAFHTSCTIFTEDSCLGHAFNRFYSFCPSSNTFWESKNKFSCSHNH